MTIGHAKLTNAKHKISNMLTIVISAYLNLEHKQQQQTFHCDYKLVLASNPAENWRILSEQSFTAHRWQLNMQYIRVLLGHYLQHTPCYLN